MRVAVVFFYRLNDRGLDCDVCAVPVLDGPINTQTAVASAVAHAVVIHGLELPFITYDWEGQPIADQNKITIRSVKL